MVQNSNISGINEGNRSICEYASINCIGSRDSQNFREMCSVNRGVDCSYKVVRNFDLSTIIGVL
jgi:hypothetical protein